MNLLQIDGKFHVEYDFIKEIATIVKTSNNEPIPKDEPLILFRARDKFAIDLLKIYYEMCVSDLATQYQLDGVKEILKKFIEFRGAHPERMKQPGITKGL